MSLLKKAAQCWCSKSLRSNLSSKSLSLSVFKDRCTVRDHVYINETQYIGNNTLQRETSNGYSPNFRNSLSKHGIFRKGMQNHARMLSMDVRSNGAHCWSCGRSKPRKGIVICSSCNAVQHPDPDITYFEIFDQDLTFDLDLKDLESKYKSLMKRLHPDLTHGKSAEEKEIYAHWSSLVTTAYTELLRPVSRATYLLKLRAIHVEQEGTVEDPELIMEVMEIKESLQGKPERAVLEQLNKQASARMDEWSHAFKTALKEGNDTAAINSLQRMSYFGRVCDDIRRELL